MSAEIELTCEAHVRGAAEPLITTVDGVWAYCPGGPQEGHEWRRIKPTGVELLRAGVDAPSPEPAQ
jgi:hypothetical protein